jgi:glycosyltransferase involved in cell wall biosynthesis
MVRSVKSSIPLRSPSRLSRRFGPRDLPALLTRTPTASTPQLRVLLAGKLTAMASPGGGETQLAAMARWLPQVGVQARLWRPWEDTLSQFQCLHLMGSVPEHLEVIAAAHRQRIPVALSTIAWFDFANIWREPRPLWAQLAASGRFLVRVLCPRLPSWRRRLYQAADLLLPNSQAEAEQLQRYFDIPPEKIRVIPNGADERFAEARPQAFARLVGGRDFVLYAGRIEPRKNQLNFLRAMKDAGVPIVVLGDVVPGYEAYRDACRREAGENVKFISGISHDDPLLASAYAACGCLVLASWFETPGLVALEAAMQGVPLVLPAGGSAREYFGAWADYVKPDDLWDIRRKTLAALAQPRSAELARMVRRRYTWQAAAAATREAYEKLV